MAEKVFELNGKTQLVVRSLKNLRKGYKFQREMGEILKADTASDITSDEYDPAAYFETQEKIMDHRVKFLSTFFGVTEKSLEEVDPVELVEVSEGLYSFFIANDPEVEEDESGEA
ncbi:MAG: phage tail tube assembly chaperone [Leuconostoc mesenteroides]